jgi:hypothetical protein
MLRCLKSFTVFAGALLIGTLLGATSPIEPAYADVDQGATAQPVSQVKEPPPDPKKKLAGDECKSSDECQRHHSCVKSGDKKVCEAPPRPRLPPGAVT